MKNKKCPECGSTDLRYSHYGFPIFGMEEGWYCNNCMLCFGYGKEE